MVLNLKIGDPVICITRYKDGEVTRTGLSIRYYNGTDPFGVNKVSASRDIHPTIHKNISFSEFIAVVPYNEFDPIRDINHFITNYKVK